MNDTMHEALSTFYLSRLVLNPRSRQVHRELADFYQLHRTVMQGFAGRADRPGRVLFRLEIHPRTGIPTLLIQSLDAPDWSFLQADSKNYLMTASDLPLEVENPGVKLVNLQLRTGQILAFRLRANPAVKKGRENQKQGRRLGLLGETAQLDWLARKIEAAGARLLSAQVAQDAFVGGVQVGGAEQANDLRFLCVQFEGRLQVLDPRCLAEAVRSGIGPAKGFGFGLLSLAPASA